MGIPVNNQPAVPDGMRRGQDRERRSTAQPKTGAPPTISTSKINYSRFCSEGAEEGKWLVFSRTSPRAMVASALMIDAF